MVQGALGVISALAAFPPPNPLGIIGAALIGVATALQIAVAVKAKNNAIAAANGGGGGGGTPQATKNLAEGGYVEGPGTATSDSIPANLSNGEFVVNAAATAGNLDLLNNINNGANANSGSSARMEMLMAKLEKRMATPPKAYVVSTEIQEGLDSDAYLERRAELTN